MPWAIAETRQGSPGSTHPFTPTPGAEGVILAFVRNGEPILERAKYAYVSICSREFLYSALPDVEVDFRACWSSLTFLSFTVVAVGGFWHVQNVKLYIREFTDEVYDIWEFTT